MAQYSDDVVPQRRLSEALGACAALCLIVSIFLPYWQARLFAPQYPKGLGIEIYAYKAVGTAEYDLGQIDLLNHYIGMESLSALAVWERRAAIPGIILLVLLCFATPWIKDRRLRLGMALPVLAYPAIFTLDFKFWLHYASTRLDPTAPLKLPPFSIPLLGVCKIAQFRSELGPEPGFYLALAASALVLAALLTERGKSSEPGVKVASGVDIKIVTAVLLAFAFGTPKSWADGHSGLQEIISNAPVGAVIDLPQGIYAGPITINRPLTLRGHGGTVIDGHGQGTVVAIRSSGVALEGLTIQGSGESLLFEDSGVRIEAASAAVRDCVFRDVLFGVFLVHAQNATIERNNFTGKDLSLGMRGDLIRSWNSDGVAIKNNTIQGGRDVVLWFSTGSVIEGNIVTQGRYGLHFMYTHNAVVRANIFSGNSVGFYVMYSIGDTIEGNRFVNQRGPIGMGLGLKESDSAVVQNNVLTGNRQGIYIDNSPDVFERRNVFRKNLIAYNDAGLSILPGVRGNLFSGNSFIDNLEQVSLLGEGELRDNDWSEGGQGNFWSDYAGYGPAGARVGRMPYRLENAFGRIADEIPLLRFFAFTPAAHALDAAAKAFPIFMPKPILTDPFPLLKPETPAPPKTASSPAAWAVSVGLFGISGLILPFFGTGKRRKTSAIKEDTKDSSAVNQAPAITAQEVCKTYGSRQVLKDFSFSVKPGESVVLWGANGAGKSTLLKCLLGLEPFDGLIRVCGHDVKQEGLKAKRLTGYVAQEFAGYDWTVTQSMEFVCAARGVASNRIAPILSSCGLVGQENKLLPALSGGMRQKLALAQALVGDPVVLVLDEPCSNLDFKSRNDLLAALCGLKGSRTLLVTSHRIEEAELLADRIIWMEEGLAPREIVPDDLASIVGKKCLLNIRLEDPQALPRALKLLEQAGFNLLPNGKGLLVFPNGGGMLEPVRALEASGIRVQELHREADIS